LMASAADRALFSDRDNGKNIRLATPSSGE
jgi:hypothetical protein